MRTNSNAVHHVILRFFDEQKASLTQDLILLLARDTVAFSGSDNAFVLFFLFFVLFGRGQPFLQNRVQIGFDVVIIFIVFVVV